MAGAFHKEMGTYIESRHTFRRVRLGFKRRVHHIWSKVLDNYRYYVRHVKCFVIPQKSLPELRDNMVAVFDRETSPLAVWCRRVFLQKKTKPESVDPELVEKTLEEGRIK